MSVLEYGIHSRSTKMALQNEAQCIWDQGHSSSDNSFRNDPLPSSNQMIKELNKEHNVQNWEKTPLESQLSNTYHLNRLGPIMSQHW